MLGVSAWKDRFRQLAIDPDDPVATKTAWGTMLRRKVKAARALKRKGQIYASEGASKANLGTIEPARVCRARVLDKVQTVQRFHRGRLTWIQPEDWNNTPEEARISTLIGMDFSGSRISDIHLVTHLPDLCTLNLSGCRGARGFHDLRALTRLTDLDLSNCTQISLCHFLTDLVSLRSLNLFGCLCLTDLAPVANLTSLTTLDFGQCYRVSDFSFMRPLKLLEHVNMEGDTMFGSEINEVQLPELKFKLRDVSMLGGLTNLRVLSFASWQHLSDQDLHTVAMLSCTTSLDLDGCPVHNIACLAKLERLELLVLQGTLVEDISVVSKLHKLKVLHASRCPELRGPVPDFTDLQDASELHLRANPLMDPIAAYPEPYLQRLQDAFVACKGRLWLDIDFPHVTTPLIHPDVRFAVASYPLRGCPFLCYRLLKLAQEGRLSFLCVFDSNGEFVQRGTAYGDESSPHAREALVKSAVGDGSGSESTMSRFKKAAGDQSVKRVAAGGGGASTKPGECALCQRWSSKQCKACYWYERWCDNIVSLHAHRQDRRNTIVCIDIKTAEQYKHGHSMRDEAAAGALAALFVATVASKAQVSEATLAIGSAPSEKFAATLAAANSGGAAPVASVSEGVGHVLERKYLKQQGEEFRVMSATDLLTQVHRATAWRAAVRDMNWSATQVCTMAMAPKGAYTKQAQQIVAGRIGEFCRMVYTRHYRQRKELLENEDGTPIELPSLPICEACAQLGTKPQKVPSKSKLQRSPTHGSSTSHFSCHSTKDIIALSKKLIGPDGCEELHHHIPIHPKFACCILLLETVLGRDDGAVRSKPAEAAALAADVAAVYAEYGMDPLPLQG
jgi:hypothetical protein